MTTERAKAAGFHDGGYRLVYADPPWQYRDTASAGARGASHKYQVMTIDAIKALPIADICAPDCVLAMWHVPPMPREALDLCAAWGFTFKTMKLFTWVKGTKHGRRAFGMGSYTRGNSEDVLLGARGDYVDTLDAWPAEDCLLGLRGKRWRESAAISQLVEAPIREHSRKPDEVPELLVQLFGTVKRIELFARRRRSDGWDYWGNEL